MTQTNTYTKGEIGSEVYEYVDATFFNSTTANIPINLNFQRNDIFPFPSRNYMMTVARFNLDSQLVPSYVPYIRTNNNDLPQAGSIPTFTYDTSTMLPPQGTVVPQNATSLYFEMSLRDVSGGGTFISGSYVNWFPYNNVFFLPSQTLDRQNTLLNPYFHSYSTLYIMGLIQDQLSTLWENEFVLPLTTLHPTWTYLIDTQIRIIKNQDASYSLLLPQVIFTNPNDITDFTISFNGDLINILPFDSNPEQTIGLDNRIKTMNKLYIDTFTLNPQIYGNFSYYVITTIFGSSYLNPWCDLTLTTVNLPIVPQLVDNSNQATSVGGSTQQLYTQSSRIVTDYLMITDNPDALKQVITYQPTNYVRWVNLKNSNINMYDVVPYLTTSEGYNVPISLLPRTSFSIKLIFRYTPH